MPRWDGSGSRDRYDYGGVGNAIILASRLSSEAAAGEILIAQRTFAAIDGAIPAEPAGDRQLKGFSRPMATYAIGRPILEEIPVRDRPLNQWPDAFVIDLPIDRAVFDALVEMTGGDFAFVDDLIDTYFDDAREQLAAMQAAVASPDAAALVRPAHSLKIDSFNVGAMALGRLCQDLEQRARTGSLDDAAGRVASIAASFSHVRDALVAERAARSAG